MVVRVCMEGGDPQNDAARINKEYRRALGKTFPHAKPYKKILWNMCGGKAQVNTEFRRMVKSRFDRAQIDRETILMLKDSDGCELDGLRGQVCDGMSREVRETVDADTDIHFMVQAIEAWFLANEQLIRSKYAQLQGEFPAGDPEAIPDPKGTLISITGGSYKSKKAPELLREIDRDVVYNKCPAFKSFDDRLRDA